MKLTPTHLRLSASDVANHLACRHLTELDKALAEKRIPYPHAADVGLDAMRQRGFEHEKRYLAHLITRGLEVVEIPEDDALARTKAAMARGADVIAQARLAHGRWLGIADVLLKVLKPSNLGAFSYEPHDTKLSRETKGSAVLQLCLYCDLLDQAQGVLPEHLHVVPPGVDFTPHSFRVRDVYAYYGWVKRQLEAEVARTDTEFRHYPEPVELCEVCKWGQRCTAQVRVDDHLSLVAGITRGQRRELEEHQITRLDALAKVPLPLWRPERGSVESLTRTREQARIQLESRLAKEIRFETLALEPGRGLFLLPEPSLGDVFFDIEGDPFVEEGGLEYLFGYALQGAPRYTVIWALDRDQEKAMFETFVDCVMTLWAKHPGMHVYHYAPYEPSALKRLMGRYGTRENEVDQLLRGGVFVDLYSVVRQGLRVGVESYSIKRLEPLFRFDRQVPLPEAGDARHQLEQLLELGGTAEIPDAMKETVRGYNEDDCLSALHLRDWLEVRRAELVQKGHDIPRPLLESGEATESQQATSAATKAVHDSLVVGVAADATARTDEEQGRWLLAQLLDFYRRESKVDWWECFRLGALSDDDLFEERGAVARLTWVETVVPVAGRKKVPVERYAFPPQDCELNEGVELRVPDENLGTKVGTLVTFDPEQGTLDIKKTKESLGTHPTAVYGFQKFNSDEQEAALLRLGSWVAEHGLDARGSHRAARDLLLRRPPRLKDAPTGALQADGETTVDAACRLAVALRDGVLPIQGPPGCGKTYTGAQLICALVAAGKKVGVTATSHKVIDHLLQAVAAAAKEKGQTLACGHKDDEAAPGIAAFADNGEALKALDDGDIQVLGGTAWLWSRAEAAGAVDVLVVDEAGQFSLANALAVAQAAESVILVGDPRQLEQPIKGTHPDGAARSALEHLLGEATTVPPERGLFLGETHRLHPSLCAFTSELFYDERLQARAGCEKQRLEGTKGFDGAGLWLSPVEHTGNDSSAPEEVEVVAAMVDRLLVDGASWVTASGGPRKLWADDLLIVAPYNAQVNRLARRLPGMRIGTVDKFQGQEAPVVIISMSSSSADDAPRGMEFLYSPNRFNVATSRARCACILVASPRLFEPTCRTPRQMRLANAFSRYGEMARVVQE